MSETPSSPVSPLAALLTAPQRRQRVVQDCAVLIDEEVQKKGGLGGMMLKAAYGTVKAVKPGFVPEAVDHLLDDFAKRLSPFYEEFTGGKTPAAASTLVQHFARQQGSIAEALLGITDDRARGVTSGVVKKTYEKLRPTARKHVEEAVPGIARLIEKHAATG